MFKDKLKNALFVISVAAAIICIAFGSRQVWKAFTEFDESILREKDSQFYSLIRSDDVNIENSLDAFIREAETLFGSIRLSYLRREWEESEDKDTSGLKRYLEDNTLIGNPLYADLIMINKGKIVVSASNIRDYSFITEPDDHKMRICTDSDGRYYLAFEYRVNGRIDYDALINLEQLYNTVQGGDTERDMMLLDRTSTFILYKEGDKVVIDTVDAEADNNIAVCRDWLTDCQNRKSSDGTSLTLTKEDGREYTARMVVIPSEKTTNGEFAIGVTADYDEAIGPSRKAAEKILIYGGLAVAGGVLLILMVILLTRKNTANTRELDILKKKNAAMEELNQNMLALSHHQRLETVGTMTASIAHDFNNLLTPIMGYSMMCMEMLPPGMEDIQENLMEVYNASVKAKDMVTRLAEITKKGKEEEYKELDPAEIIRNTLKVTIPAKPKNVEVKGYFHTGQARMRGDSTQISQMILNIVLNAYDAMREKGGTLFVSSKLEDGRIVMRFKDTGGGMDAETIARIFDPFFTTKESGKGTGLGLAIVAQIAETHDGKVYVNSTPGEGTEFRITFPVVEESATTDRARTIQISSAELREMLDAEDD